MTATATVTPTDHGVAHHFAAGVYAKQLHLEAGFTVLSHAHKYDHLSILAAGRCVVRTQGADGAITATEYAAPSVVTIVANVMHQIEALEDVTWYCVHAVDTALASVADIDEVLIAPAN